MSYKIDLHTHSIISHDGGITNDQYRTVLDTGALDYVAVTDHNRIERALELHELLGDRIIVGEEIRAQEGEVIGLYMTDLIPPGLPVRETVEEVRRQSGLVYLPHIFEIRRHGLDRTLVEQIIDKVDIVEIYNPHTWYRDTNVQREAFVENRNLAYAASSDSHSGAEIGRTYTTITEKPTGDNLKRLLRDPEIKSAPIKLHHMLYPTLNRLKKGLDYVR